MLRTGSWLITVVLSLPALSAVPSVKVLIGKSLDQVVVEGIDMHKTMHSQKHSRQYQGRKSIEFNCKPKHVSNGLNGGRPLLLASLKSPTGLISWGKNKYQGELHLLGNPGKPSCDLVNSIPMESYIMTLLAKEMNGSWPTEALKAQAVAARTYAYERLLGRNGAKLPDQQKLYHLESSEKDQVSGSFFDITENTLKATRETAGEILVGPSGKVAPAFFHSKCGGKTLRPDQVWGGVEEGYRSVNCTFCQKTGMKDWNHTIQKGQMRNMVDLVLRRYYADEAFPGDIKLISDSLENSELRFYLGDRLHIVKKSYLRNLMGRELLPSNNFQMTMGTNGFEVKGHGYGHGVGLCQLGALELAKRGYDYRQILSFYFPRHKMKKAY
jgi:stage II sporulation protein D